MIRHEHVTGNVLGYLTHRSRREEWVPRSQLHNCQVVREMDASR